MHLREGSTLMPVAAPRVTPRTAHSMVCGHGGRSEAELLHVYEEPLEVRPPPTRAAPGGGLDTARVGPGLPSLFKPLSLPGGEETCSHFRQPVPGDKRACLIVFPPD